MSITPPSCVWEFHEKTGTLASCGSTCMGRGDPCEDVLSKYVAVSAELMVALFLEHVIRKN